jgi:glutaredoxin
MKALLATLLLVTISFGAHAQVYKWTDKHGATHYGDRPPLPTEQGSSPVKVMEMSPVQVKDDGTVINPNQNTPQPHQTPNAQTHSDTNQNTTINATRALVLQWAQRFYLLVNYIIEQVKTGHTDTLLNNVLAQINTWRESSIVITNDTLQQFSQTNDSTSANTANTVDIYTAVWCGACKKAKQWLRQNNIPFTEYDVERDASAALRMRKLGGGGGIPFAVINGKTFEGFNAFSYSSALHR